MVYSNPFPSLKAYAELIKTFQRSVWPHTGKFSSLLGGTAVKDFRFATGLSNLQPLSQAVVDCVGQVQQKLGQGVQPDFCQLLVTPALYGNHAALAPKYVQEIFGSHDVLPPPLIGGVVSGLIADFPQQAKSQSSSHRGAEGISLLAAVLPGVSLHPFHARSASLPTVDWSELLKGREKGNACNSAAFLLAEPNFHEVDELTERLQNVMPSMPIVGGPVHGSAAVDVYGRESVERGTLFLNDCTFSSGAVGCILNGNLQMDTLSLQSCRPVGPVFKVTAVEKVSGRNVVVELDNSPEDPRALLAAFELLSLKAMTDNSTLMDIYRQQHLKIGVDPTGTGTSFMICDQTAVKADLFNFGKSTALPGCGDLEPGSLVQYHLEDITWAQNNAVQQLQSWLESRPESKSGSGRSQGMFLYSTKEGEQSAISQMQGRLQSLELQACKIDGRQARLARQSPEDTATPLTSSSGFGSFGILRQQSQTEQIDAAL